MDIFRYKLADILNFSPDAYYRMIELYNTQLGSLPIIFATLLGVILLISLSRPTYGRQTALLLIITLLWTAYSFHYQNYSTINWLALIYAALFFLRAALITWSGLITNSYSSIPKNPTCAQIGGFICIYAIILHPAVTTLKQGVEHIEVFGLHPTPTLIAFCGVLIWRKAGLVWPNLALPTVYFTIEGAISLETGAYEVLAGVTAVILSFCALFTRQLMRILPR